MNRARFDLPARALRFYLKYLQMVVAFDKDTLSIVGDTVPLLEDLRVAAHGGANVRMNDLGQLFFISREGIDVGENQVVIIDEWGGVSRIPNEVGNCSAVRLSPDGKRMAMVIESEDSEAGIFVANLDGSERVQLSKRNGQFGFPIWSPDGLRLYYVSDFRGSVDLTLRSIEFELSEAGSASDIGSLAIVSRSEITKLPNRIFSPNALPDGQGIIATVPALSLADDPAVIHVMLNADDRLRTIAPYPDR